MPARCPHRQVGEQLAAAGGDVEPSHLTRTEPDGQAARSGDQIDVPLSNADVGLTRAGAQRHRTMRDVDLEVATAARHDEPMAQISEPDRAGRRT